jgi:hypothetical protein
MSDSNTFSDLLGRVFDEHRADLRQELSPEDYARRRAEFVFHMSDFTEDLQGLASMQESPENWPPERARTFLIGCLYHIIPHLKAAGRLLLDEVPDPFERGLSVKETRAHRPHNDAESKRAYWGVVEDCLVRFFNFTKPAAHGTVNRYRRDLENPPPGIMGDLIYREEPFYIACSLASVHDVETREQILSEHDPEYRSILLARGW